MMITKNYIAKGEGANRFEKIPVQIYETADEAVKACLLFTSPSPRDKRQSRMPSSA